MTRRTNLKSSAPTETRPRRPRVSREALRYETMSQLGRDLFDLSVAYEREGNPLLDAREVERELARRRGGAADGD